ncbi:hypothetical protein AQ482_13750, partial [Acinetobacter baumannii]
GNNTESIKNRHGGHIAIPIIVTCHSDNFFKEDALFSMSFQPQISLFLLFIQKGDAIFRPKLSLDLNKQVCLKKV